jgi:hypothetical protein
MVFFADYLLKKNKNIAFKTNVAITEATNILKETV